MMTLALMKRFFDRVAPDGSSPLADLIVARWFPQGATARVWRASANFVFEVRAANREYFLRFNHATERQVPFLEAECRYLEYLTRRGVAVNQPVPSVAGLQVESVETEMGLFHAVLFDAVPGEHREIEQLDLSAFEAWGQLVGAIHAASEGYELRGRSSWSDLVTRARDWLPEGELAAQRELDRAELAMGARYFNRSNYGLIHYDLELDNILWGERAGVVDFDDCAFFPFAADIAFALRDLWDDHAARIDFADPRLEAFLRGYRGNKSLEDNEVRALPLYLRVHSVVMFARLVRTLAEPTPDAPEWTDKLRAKLEGVLERKRAEFAGFD